MALLPFLVVFLIRKVTLEALGSLYDIAEATDLSDHKLQRVYFGSVKSSMKCYGASIEDVRTLGGGR